MTDLGALLADMFDPPDGMPGQDPFVCGRAECDGMPHGDFKYRHARAPQQSQFFTAEGWFIAFFQAGRGTGKTRTGAEWMVDQMHQQTQPTYWGVVAPTFDDGRDICISGESGILFVLDRRKIRYHWNKSLGILDLVDNGAKCELYSDLHPDRLRGPNLTGAWVDEPASMPNAIGSPSKPGTWDNLLLMCRKGDPRIMVTGTPKPSQFIKDTLIPAANLLVRGSSHDNRANLADAWYDNVIAPMEGTSLGRQEIAGEVLEDIDGALWKSAWIRVRRDVPPLRDFDKVRIGWDPAVTAHDKSDLHGIVIAGLANDQMWVLEDLSDILTPAKAAMRVLRAAVRWGCPIITVEPNQGGDVWETLITQAKTELESEIGQFTMPKVDPKTSVHSKEARAQPLAQQYESAFYEVYHVPGLDALQIEMTTWVPGEKGARSPNRIDALTLVGGALGRIFGVQSAGSMAAAARQAKGIAPMAQDGPARGAVAAALAGAYRRR